MLVAKKALIYTTVLIFCLLSLFSCEKPAPDGDKLVIVSPHPEGIEKEFDRTFKAWYQRETNKTVTLDWIDRGGSSSDFRFIESEFQRVPEGIGIDLFFGGGTDNYIKLADKGMLTAYKLPDAQLKRIPKSLFGIPIYDPQYRWYGAALSSFGIMHNEEFRQLLNLPVVSTWQDLTNPDLIGKIGAADPRESGSAHMMYEIILQGYGWEKGFEVITKLGANVKAFSAGASAIPKDVAIGQAIYGMAIDFYAYAHVVDMGPEKIGYTLPPDAAVVSPDSIAILKGAPNLAVAQKFIEFVLSDEAQKLWMLRDTDPEGPKWKGGLNRRSVVPALYDQLGDRCVVGNPFKLDVTPVQYDAEKGGNRWDIVNDLIGSLVIDPHQNLVDAWEEIAKSKDASKREAAIQALVKVPVTEEEAMQMAESDWDQPDYRNQTLKEWGDFAVKKFKEARELAN